MEEAHHDVGDLHPGVVDVVLDAHRVAAAAQVRTSVSPSTALRRWPMWAALLGLMLVCSTITRSIWEGGGPAARSEA
jgi:sugar/nucleoside kinase (ribokinase family)